LGLVQLCVFLFFFGLLIAVLRKDLNSIGDNKMNSQYKLYLALIGLTFLSGCATHSNHLQQALSLPDDLESSISINELLNRAKGQPSSNQPPPLNIAKKAPTPSKPMLLTFMSNRAKLTSRHIQTLQRFSDNKQSSKSAYGSTTLNALQINCAPSAEADPYAAASTGMSRCLNVSRFLERSNHNTKISLQPSLPNNQIQISE